ncbi:mediator of RNA polymerase II transcription subunit 15-like [Ischnura elegans]|uniref:mediator of RNA polymerase II transcription subunit 15-like n=1 Tax=Ischnura elegans TaxID=197161 RepID=UPI001ED8790C|nr:mediator of RNA polymerase II transcription subunit 15-like [Ischnura elegans]
MSAALKIAIIVTALCALANAETKVTNDKEKRGSDKEPSPLQVIQGQQKQQVIPQQTYQLVYPQGSVKGSPGSQYTPEQLQYIYQQAVLPQLQKQAVPAPVLPQQYVIQQQPQFQYVPVPQQHLAQPQLQAKGVASGAAHAPQLQGHFPQPYLGGQYYFHPSQLAGVLGTHQYQHPGAAAAAPYYYVPQHQAAPQFYLPQGHHAGAVQANPAFYFGGQLNPFAGHQQFYFPQQQAHHPQQLLNQNVKGAGLEVRGKDSYALPPYENIQHLQQYSTLPDSLVDGNAALRAGPVQAQQSPALNLNGKYATKAGPERQQG